MKQNSICRLLRGPTSGQKQSASPAQRQAGLFGKTTRLSQHPFYWASFVQLGDVQPLQLSAASSFWNLRNGLLVGSAALLLLFLGRWMWRRG